MKIGPAMMPYANSVLVMRVAGSRDAPGSAALAAVIVWWVIVHSPSSSGPVIGSISPLPTPRAKGRGLDTSVETVLERPARWSAAGSEWASVA